MSTITPPDSPCLTGSTTTDRRIGSLIADRYQLVDVLGVGAYGTVYKAKDLVTGQLYAIKALNRTGLDPRQQRFQTREIELHYHASLHPNVLSMYDIITSKDCIYVLLEYCPEGDLFAKITEEGHYVRNDHAARRVFLQLLHAVQYCHSQSIYHRDLKPENIMVTDHGYNIKLGDFGLATRDKLSQDFGCGSTFYMSPECQEPNPYPAAWYRSAPNDIWALGVVLINLTCGRNPWKRASMADSTYKAFRKNPDFLRTILPISDELNYVLQRIFEVDPAKRISLDQLINLMSSISKLTVSEQTAQPLTPPYSPEPSTVYDAVLNTPPYSVRNSIIEQTQQLDELHLDSATETVPTLNLPSPRYNKQPNVYGNAGIAQLPPSPPASDRGSVDYSHTIQSGQQLKSAYLDPTYHNFYTLNWNAYLGTQCLPQHWTQTQFPAHYPAVY